MEGVTAILTEVLRNMTTGAVTYDDVTTTASDNVTTQPLRDVITSIAPSTALTTLPDVTSLPDLVTSPLAAAAAAAAAVAVSPVVYVVVALVVSLALVGAVVWCRLSARRSETFVYDHVSAHDDDAEYDYLYKPLERGYLDEEYSNTFVGISVPILQDVTEV